MNTWKLILSALLYFAGLAGLHAGLVTYTYDDAGRLTQADYGGETRIDYIYDANGNLLQRTVTTGGTVTYTLIYRAGTGGWIDGVATQVVAAGESGTAVSAVVADAGAEFGRWSDGGAGPTRTDTDVQADLTVYASFHSTGGALVDGFWTNVPGMGLRPGQGEGPTREDTLTDTNATPAGLFYRLEVELP